MAGGGSRDGVKRRVNVAIYADFAEVNGTAGVTPGLITSAINLTDAATARTLRGADSFCCVSKT